MPTVYTRICKCIFMFPEINSPRPRLIERPISKPARWFYSSWDAITYINDPKYIDLQRVGRSLLCCDVYISLFKSNTCVLHYSEIIMGAIASQITSLAIVYSTVYSDAEQRKYRSAASLTFVRDGVSNQQPHDCLLNGLFRRRSKNTSKLRVTSLCAEN